MIFFLFLRGCIFNFILVSSFLSTIFGLLLYNMRDRKYKYDEENFFDFYQFENFFLSVRS